MPKSAARPSDSVQNTAAAAEDLSPLRYLKGIGPKRAEVLAKIGIKTPHDLIYLFPRRYEDRRALARIADLQPNQSASIQGEVLTCKIRPIRRMPILEVVAGDGTATITAVWFNQPYLKTHFVPGRKVVLYGRVELYKQRMQMNSPEFEFIEDDEFSSVHTGRITPIYPLTEGLFQRSLRTVQKHLIDSNLDEVVRDFLPSDFRNEHHLQPLSVALRSMHFPEDLETLSTARRRIVFDEFLFFQLLLYKKIQHIRSKLKAWPMTGAAEALLDFKKALSFELTSDQDFAAQSILEDLSTSVPMNRLLQGDVGCGKTVVAAAAMLLASCNRLQSAFLIPTEILAEQHAKTLSSVLERLGISVGLLTASTPDDRRSKIVSQIKSGNLSVLIGTHAMLQEDIQFSKLGLLVIDEQHKFGVHQRNLLLDRHPRPHQLVMTATPIPRTLALTLYGDLETSTIRQMPKGRQPIKTYWINRNKQGLVLKHLREKIEAGDQSYIIFPMIEETEKSDLLSAKKEYEKLRKGALSGIAMGLVHGKLSASERDPIMLGFRNGSIKVLVATSVIEVGVDNPNATIMIIENAERFGLAQLHQMRGRVGRGDKASECFLFGEPKTEEGAKRLRILTQNHDGFVIAEEDLKLRGPGDFWGTRQSGDPLFRVANPISDRPILEEARSAAKKIVAEHLLEKDPDWQPLRSYLDENPLKY